MYGRQDIFWFSTGLVCILQLSSLFLLQSTAAAAQYTSTCIGSSYFFLILWHLWIWEVKPYLKRPTIIFTVEAVSLIAILVDQIIEVLSFVDNYTRMERYNSEISRSEWRILAAAIVVYSISWRESSEMEDSLKNLSHPIVFSALWKVAMVLIYKDTSVSTDRFWTKSIGLFLVRFLSVSALFYYSRFVEAIKDNLLNSHPKTQKFQKFPEEDS